jgi:hypothetical protein
MPQGLRLDLNTHHFMKMSSGDSVDFTRATASFKSAVLRNLCTDRPYHIESQQLTKLATLPTAWAKAPTRNLICDAPLFSLEWFRG